MSDFPQASNVDDGNKIEIPFKLDQPLRKQIESAVASLPPRPCDRHPHELRPLDKEAMLNAVLYHDYPYGEQKRSVDFAVIYARCDHCPHNDAKHNIDVEKCPVGPLRLGTRNLCARDNTGRPVIQRYPHVHLDPDVSVQQQLKNWLLTSPEIKCERSGQMLRRLEAKAASDLGTLRCVPRYAPCLQCSLERLGLTPEEAKASFANFNADTATLRTFLAKCREYAAAPAGVLLLLGHTGTGKTHLATAIAREVLRRGWYNIKIIKHRHFIEQYRLSQRPVPFGEEPPVNPLQACQQSELLVYDEFTPVTDGVRSYEDVLLDLFENRIGNRKPSIITTNIANGKLEAALGSRLYDRLQLAAYAVLEFGFDSRRRSLNAAYLSRCGTSDKIS